MTESYVAARRSLQLPGERRQPGRESSKEGIAVTRRIAAEQTCEPARRHRSSPKTPALPELEKSPKPPESTGIGRHQGAFGI